MHKISIIVGTRPNFIKVTRFKELASNYGCEIRIIHTGQHYDQNMVQVFFDQFGLRPDVFLNVPGGTQIEQVAEIMRQLEKEFEQNKPDLVLVPGDVNSTFASAFVAHRMGVKLGHIESGLRSSDMGMPEEVNRILTDRITDLYFITEESGEKNLLREGVDPAKIHFVGNTMIDTLVRHEPDIAQSDILEKLNLKGNYALMTMHRPSNVDDELALEKSVEVIETVANKCQLVLPIHPRTKQRLDDFGLFDRLNSNHNVHLAGPMAYFDFQRLIKDAVFVVTDSGGIQEETTFRKVPCITLRQNTERPITIDMGSNVLMEMNPEKVSKSIDQILSGNWKNSEIPSHWDGHSTERILDAIRTDLG